jgi:catechol 2,3-dioxygenase
LPARNDLALFLLHCRERRVPFGSADHLSTEALYLTDPDGLAVEVYRDRPREEWRITGDGEILATIDRLDEEGLTASVVGSWTGMPAETSIGHIHFSVADLRVAASFYHAGLGFDQVLWSLSGALFVSAGLYHHHVGLNTWSMGSPAATENDAKLLWWELVLPDEETLQGAVESLRRMVQPVTRSGGGYLASDPWGIAVVLRT